MFSIEKYESLKKNETRENNLKYVLSLTNKDEITNYLKDSSLTSYDDLQILLFILKSTKNYKDLFQIFQTDSFPVKQRAFAIKSWLRLSKDEKEIEEFVVQSINDRNLPRYLKHQILKDLHRISYLKKCSSFFCNLLRRLTESNNHDQYNLDGHLLPFCLDDEILHFLSQWSIERLEQIDSSSILRSKLICYKPKIIVHLIKGDLNEKKKNNEQLINYFTNQQMNSLFSLIAKKEVKLLCQLTIEYLYLLEKHQRFLPEFIQSQQKLLFGKAFDQMIEIITIVASNQPGRIKYSTHWNNQGHELTSFSFPQSFSLQNYVQLFFALYDTCKWSTLNTDKLLQLMLQEKGTYSSLSEIKKRQKWFFNIVIEERIGKDAFIQKLLKEGNENNLSLLEEFPSLTTPLSEHLISQIERNGIVEAKKHLSLLRYQRMTEKVFDQFLSLFKETGSDVNQRQENYPLFLQCAISTNEENVDKVFQWIEKRFANEQLSVIESFLSVLSSYSSRFQLEILPNNFQRLESILNIAFNHLQRSINTLTIICNIGINLLQRVEYHHNKEQRNKIQSFASKMIKQCFLLSDTLPTGTIVLNQSYPRARQIFADILVSNFYPKLISKLMLDQLNDSFNSFFVKPCLLEELDSFLNSFFTVHLPSSSKVQSAFQIDKHSEMISLFLKKRSTRFERVNQLINKIDKIFFINEDVQRIALSSQQHRQLIDQLIEDNKCFTYEKLENEESKLSIRLTSQTKNMKLPGLNLNVLNTYLYQLTGKQQQHITNIILNDYLQDKSVSNRDKLKSLRILRRSTHTYNQTLQWINEKQDSPLTVKGDSSGTRGADGQSLDDIIICLPATFDLNCQNLLKHFDLLTRKLNSSNAKYLSDALLNISRKVNDQIFLKVYLEFIQNEQFEKLGITANKQIIRLLIQFVSNPNLIKSLLKPLWDNRPHQDIRACLIFTLLHFIGKTNSNDDQNIIWTILEEAATDEYLLVTEYLFDTQKEGARWPLLKLKYSSNQIFEIFVNKIQFLVLDHPTSLKARSSAWLHIDYKHANKQKLISKAEQLCIQFDKDSKTLWESAFTKIIFLYKEQEISSLDIIINIIEKVMLRREEIDSNENGVDSQHDLPVYHRIENILKNIISNIDQFNNEQKMLFHSLTSIILQFDKTLAIHIGRLFIKIAQNKEDLQQIFKILQENLPENYFENILIQLSKMISEEDSSCPFIQQLNIDDKFDLIHWFTIEQNRGLLFFQLFQKQILDQTNIYREKYQNLLRQMRQAQNLSLRQQALEYTVTWNDDNQTTLSDDNDQD